MLDFLQEKLGGSAASASVFHLQKEIAAGHHENAAHHAHTARAHAIHARTIRPFKKSQAVQTKAELALGRALCPLPSIPGAE
jgi:hypothetical protein